MTRPRISAEEARALRERVARADAALLAWASPPFDRAGDLEHARTCGRGENPLCSRCAEPGLARSDLFNAATALTEEVEALHAELAVATKPPPGATVWVMIGVRRYTVPADKAEALRQFVAALGGEVVG